MIGNFNALSLEKQNKKNWNKEGGFSISLEYDFVLIFNDNFCLFVMKNLNEALQVKSGQ